jgi:predicted dehydrogenase
VQKLGIGIIGCGYWGPNFVRITNTHNRVSVRKVCDKDPVKLREISRRYPGLECVSDISTLLGDDSIHAVIICTPVVTHFDIARRSLMAGKHVLCEKPLTLSVVEAEALHEIAIQRGLTLMTGHVFEYNSIVLYLQSKILEDSFGDLVYIQMQRMGLGPARTDVNVAYDLAAHDISIVLMLLGQMPLSVSARGSSFISQDGEDTAFIVLEFPRRVLVQINVSWIDAVKQREIKVVGTKQVLLFNDISLTEKLKIFNNERNYQSADGDFGSFQLSVKDGDVFIPNISYPEPLSVEFDHFIDCTLHSKTPKTDSQNAIRVIRVLEAIDMSLRQDGAKVMLEPELAAKYESI